jgi:hypothetical protein
MASSDDARGASQSLNKTITEIMEFLGDDGQRAAPGTLRPFLHEKVADLAEKWLKRGFKRGCIEAKREFDVHGSFPKQITYKGNRELFTGHDRAVKLSWKSKKVVKPSAKKGK